VLSFPPLDSASLPASKYFCSLIGNLHDVDSLDSSILILQLALELHGDAWQKIGRYHITPISRTINENVAPENKPRLCVGSYLFVPLAVFFSQLFENRMCQLINLTPFFTNL
jgi:hypothetical protein